MSTIAIEIVMDDGYFREFHREYVAALCPGLRRSKRLAIAFSIIGVGLGALGWTFGGIQMPATTVTAFVIAVLIFASLARRKRSWLECVRALPQSGSAIRIEVRDGVLVQVKESASDPNSPRNAAIVSTPNGYLVKVPGLGDASNPAASATDASVYLPHRAITPAMTREAFLGSLSSVGEQD